MHTLYLWIWHQYWALGTGHWAPGTGHRALGTEHFRAQISRASAIRYAYPCSHRKSWRFIAYSCSSVSRLTSV